MDTWLRTGGDVKVSPHDPDIIFCAGGLYFDTRYHLGIARSTDGGTSWMRDTISAANYGWSIVFDPSDPARVYVAGDSASNHPALYTTTDLGQTWTSNRTGLAGKVWRIALAPGSGQVLYAASNSGVFKSTDAGETWTGTGFTTQTRTLAVGHSGPDTVYAGTYGSGVHVTTDGGATWAPLNEGLTNLRVLSLGLRPGPGEILFAGTEGGSVFCNDFGQVGISGPPARSPRLPVRLKVAPSPARGTARLEFATGTRTIARAALYDAGGRLVADLGTRELGPGSADWPFSVRAIPAGTYFVRLAVGEQTHVARLTVIE